MHFINYIWPIVVITAVNADESTLPQGNDAAQTEGIWYYQALKGNDDLNSKVWCYKGNILMEEGSKSLVDRSYGYLNGKSKLSFQDNYYMEVAATEPKLVLTFYEINEDKGRGEKICDCTLEQEGSNGRIRQYSANPPCKFGPGVDYTGICATRDEQLNAEDEQIFNELCPPNTYVKIPHVDCEDD